MAATKAPAKERFYFLDLLRGFFIVTIICDHLSRWPSIFGLMSGKALLWVTAAEGFVIISGLLVGYIRGFKGKSLPMKQLTFVLWKRAATLYLWAVLGTIIFTVALWYLPLVGGAPGLPIDKGDVGRLILESVTLNYTFLWVYFLKLYAIFLAAAPLAVWLLRQGKAWLVVLMSFALLVLGWLTKDEVLQWQFVFFMPAVAGYFIPSIQSWWRKRSPASRRSIASATIGLTVVTIILSYIGVYHPALVPLLDHATVTVFAKDSISLARVAMAFLWFGAYLLIFKHFEKQIQRWFGWLLMPVGTHSLTAYILHGFAIICISFIFAVTDNILFNSLFDILAILITWSLLKIPNINKVVPR